MGRLKQPEPERDLPSHLMVPGGRLDALLAEQEAGQCYFGESLNPPAKRQRCEASFLLYTTQQFLEHTELSAAQQRLYSHVLSCAELAATLRMSHTSGTANSQPSSVLPSPLSGPSGAALGSSRQSSLAASAAEQLLSPRPLERLTQLEDEIILTAHSMGLEWGRIGREFLAGWSADAVRQRYHLALEDRAAQQKPFNSADLLQLLPPLPRPRQQPHPDPLWRQQSQPEQPPQASMPQQSQPAAGKGSPQAAVNGAAQHAARDPPFSAAQNAVGAAQGQLGLASTNNVIQGQQLKGMQHEQVPRQPSEQPEADQPAVAPSATTAISPGGFAGAGCSPVAAPEAVSADSPRSLPADAKPLTQTELEASAEVDPTCTDIENGEIRVCLKRAMAAAPVGNTVAAAHKLPSLDGVRFYEEVCIVDRDEAQLVYNFHLRDSAHCARLDEGNSSQGSSRGAGGKPVGSICRAHALYQLTDGTAWLEHTRMVDAAGLAQLAAQLSVSPDSLLPAACPPPHPQELFVLPYRRHSRLQNVCGECWVYEGALPPDVPAAAEGAAYVWRVELEAHKLRPT